MLGQEFSPLHALPEGLILSKHTSALSLLLDDEAVSIRNRSDESGFCRFAEKRMVSEEV